MGDNKTDAEPEHVVPPKKENIQKPFFAYGIFKPGQIAFSKIKDLTYHWKPIDDVHRELHIRDGVPIIENIDSSRITKGYVIYFNKEDCEDAYNIISETEPFQLYEWDLITVDGKECNVLIGKDFNMGSHLSVDDSDRYVDNFDGKNDPYFEKLIHFLRCELKHENYSEGSRCYSGECKFISEGCIYHSIGRGFYSDNYRFYKLQMQYMLLWSAIDRYCSLKYGAYLNQWELRSKLANDDVFYKSLKECWDQNKIRRKRKVYSTFLRERKLTRNPWYAINFYYTIRCNVVHRGKEKRIEEVILSESLKELLDIFERVIEKTFL